MESERWAVYRFTEMEEKAGVTEFVEDYPEFDMDGCRFVPDYSDTEFLAREDAYLYSISKRLLSFSLDPYQDDVRLMTGDSNFGE